MTCRPDRHLLERIEAEPHVTEQGVNEILQTS